MISFFIQTEALCHADGIIFCNWITAVVVKIHNWGKNERDEKLWPCFLGLHWTGRLSPCHKAVNIIT